MRGGEKLEIAALHVRNVSGSDFSKIFRKHTASVILRSGGQHDFRRFYPSRGLGV